MTISLSDGAVTLTLHPDLYWADENAWYPVQQSVERSLTGALIVTTGAMVAGRPITLQPIDEDSAWSARLDVEQLRAWAAVPGQQLTLVLRGSSRSVIFRHHDGVAVEATPIVHYRDVADEDYYLATLRLMEI